MKKAQIASPKSGVPAAKKKTVAVSSRAKPTRSVAKKALATPRVANKTLPNEGRF
jgi:hypothetical protein